MKIYKQLILGITTLLFALACNKGIDPISSVAPGVDETAPQITITYPAEGAEVSEIDTVLNISFTVTDDIEIKTISLTLDGTEITSFTSFKDYRRAVLEYLTDLKAVGAHNLSITATDVEGKSTTSVSNFEKKQYVPLLSSETLYMNFDGNYVNRISYTEATIVGMPGYAGTGLKGSNAYRGATDGYLTFPIDGLTGSEFSGCFWYKVNGSPDRSGILNISPAGEDRTKGFRLFREGTSSEQRIKMNVGTGAGETWNDGDVLVAPGTEWVHIAFTISGTECTIYFNGAVARSVANTGIDWAGCSLLGIGSGAPNFIYWNHKSDLSDMDELRLFNEALTQEEILEVMDQDKPYEAVYDGEVFYMPFEGSYKDMVSKTDATIVGTPGFDASGKIGKAYAGATDSYLTFPSTEIAGNSFSAVFWYKVNATPDRSGILNASVTGEDRTKGFRLFREGNVTAQRIKLNVGIGTGETWNDGQEIDAQAGEWVHIAFTVSSTNCIIYVNGAVAADAASAGAPDWTGISTFSIGSGAPNFIYWGHGADLSLYDELRLFDKALSQAEIQAIIADEN
jgi:hypothetical protein